MKSRIHQQRAACWFSHVARWRQSDMGKTEYCKAHGLSLSSFRYWLRKSHSETAAGLCALPPAIVSLPFALAPKPPTIGLMVGNRYALGCSCRLRRSYADQTPVHTGIPMLRMPAAKVYLAPGATDMCAGIDRLSMTVQGILDLDPFSGHLFVLCNRKRDAMLFSLVETAKANEIEPQAYLKFLFEHFLAAQSTEDMKASCRSTWTEPFSQASRSPSRAKNRASSPTCLIADQLPPWKMVVIERLPNNFDVL